MSSNPRIYILLFIVLLLAFNSALLDIVVFSSIAQIKATAAQSLQQSDVGESKASCSLDCKDYIATLIQEKISPAPVKITQSIPIQQSVWYIPLGSGMSLKDQYEDLLSVQAYIDTASYPSIQKAYFEVFLRNPTGNGYAQAKLFNVTDKHDVWFSEVTFEGGGTALKTAQIILEPGNKLYRVMLRSSLKYDVYVENVRIKIVSN